MSNEPENRYQDQRVTEAYRALADERAPAHLTEKVLKLAADVRTPYARARAWMRPAAWAATVGLSLAIVLELTQIPSSDSEYISIPPSTESDARGIRADGSDYAALPKYLEITDVPAAQAKKESGMAVDTTREPVAAEAPNSIEAPTRQDFAARAESVMQEAEALARARAGSDKDSAPVPVEEDRLSAESTLAEPMSTDVAVAQRVTTGKQKAIRVAEEATRTTASYAATSNAATADFACGKAERETADTWLACILQLRENGQDEQADEEYEEFRRVYPDFDDSVTDK